MSGSPERGKQGNPVFVELPSRARFGPQVHFSHENNIMKAEPFFPPPSVPGFWASRPPSCCFPPRLAAGARHRPTATPRTILGRTTVAVTQGHRGDLSKSVDLTAEFLPWQNVEIHAKVSGYVKQINVDVGDHAKAGRGPGHAGNSRDRGGAERGQGGGANPRSRMKRAWRRPTTKRRSWPIASTRRRRKPRA